MPLVVLHAGKTLNHGTHSNRMIAELCLHMIVLDRRLLQPIARSIPAIALDRTRSQSCSHIIADDRLRSSAIIRGPGFK